MSNAYHRTVLMHGVEVSGLHDIGFTSPPNRASAILATSHNHRPLLEIHNCNSKDDLKPSVHGLDPTNQFS